MQQFIKRTAYSNRFAHSARPIVGYGACSLILHGHGHGHIDMPVLIRSQIPALFSVIGLKDVANLIRQRSKIDQKMVLDADRGADS